MNWSFSPQLWLFLGASFIFGVSQAFMGLFLNFYLRSLGLGPEWQGLLNALPAVTLAVLSLPAVVLARRITNANTLKIGAALGVLGTLVMALANDALVVVLGSLLQGSGGALTVVATSPFMANHSNLQNRVTLFSLQNALMTGAGFIGNWLGGRIPRLYADYQQVSVDSLEALKATLLLSVVLGVIGLIPILFLRPSGKKHEGRSFAVRDKATMARLVLPNLLVGLGAGATIPFLNVFIEKKFQISYASLGTLFAWASLATAFTALVQPFLVSRLGQLKTVLLVQASSLPFLAMLGFAPWLWMFTIALFTRGALMNAAGPVYNAHAMSVLSEDDRPMYSAVNIMVWNLAWAGSAFASGILRSKFPGQETFSWLFGWTLLMYLSSVIATYIGLYRPAKRYTEGQDD